MGYYDEKRADLRKLIGELQSLKFLIETNLKKEKEDIEERIQSVIKEKESIVQLSKEKKKGFPWLAKAYDEYYELQEIINTNFLSFKKHPADHASQVVKEQSDLRRKAEKDKKIYEYIVRYYESICPFLVDLKEDIELPEEQPIYENYSEDEKEDKVTNYLTIEEYRQLSTSDRNQRALDRYWERHKSKSEIGRMYERYVGFEYEKAGFEVFYKGIFDGLEDLGRDLICKNGKQTIVIQCKMWSSVKTIYEKHIFQFFGTVFQYKDEHPGENVKAIFYTTTNLSPLARKFSDALKIELKEEYKFYKGYPCIKCNINESTGEKIYHLPFDQQYDRAKIRNEGEFYCSTVIEAEDAGFRRAFRYHGIRE